MKHLLDEIHTYLSSTKDCYPGGIPLATHTSSIESPTTVARSEKILIVTGSDLPKELMDFLESIVTAGMKRDLGDCELCGDDLDLEVKVTQERPLAVLVFGSLLDLPEGVGTEALSLYQEIPILVTRSLSELRLDRESKKKFWAQLQQLLPSLSSQ